MKESKATFVFGQMNEPPGAQSKSSSFRTKRLLNTFRDGSAGDGQGKGCSYSL